MNLLLVDDHPLFGIGVVHALTQARAGLTVRVALTLDEGLALASSVAPDVALIDYRLGGGASDGVEGLRRFGRAFPLVARVLISGEEEAALAARARAAGAAAFVGKSLPITRILQVLDTVCGGGEWFPEVPPAATASAGLTPRQLEVLALIAQGRQNKQIADELGIAERTVKLHITAMLDTLCARNRTHLLVRAREVGLV